jgi:hypothetical protein
MRVLAFFLAVLSPALLSAQAPSLELFASTGVVQLWDDEGSLGTGSPLAGGLGFRLPQGWAVEALVERHENNRDFDSDVRFDSTVLGGRFRLLKYFGTARAQAYVGGGVGATRIKSIYDYPTRCQLGANNQFQCFGRDVRRRTTNSAALSGFSGVRLGVGQRMFVRPEFELSRSGEHMRIGGTVAAGWGW